MGAVPARATVMTVPKAPVNQNDFLATGKDKIRFARKFRMVKAVTKAHPVYQGPDIHLRGCVRSPNTTHDLTAPCGSHSVHG